MEVSEILAAIDAQISKLQQARDLLAGVDSNSAKRGPGRPRKLPAETSPDDAAPASTRSGRKLSPEGRQRIAEAMKRRWAQRKQA